MKKMAIKGLVALAAVVALCMFFSGTIKTISTAKVRLVTAKQGKLEEEIKLSGNLTFTQTEEVKLALASDQSVTIKRVRVAKGRKVAAGDVLFEAEVSGYDKEMESLRSDYEAAQKELMELERKNGDVRLKRTEEIWVEAYDALAQSKDDLMNAQTQLEVAAKLAGVTLTDGRLPEKEQKPCWKPRRRWTRRRPHRTRRRKNSTAPTGWASVKTSSAISPRAAR